MAEEPNVASASDRSKKHPHDEALQKILESHESPMQELNFINTVFGFLGRHTKYLSHPGASKRINTVIQKHVEKAKDREIEERKQVQKQKEEEEKAKQAQEAQEKKEEEPKEEAKPQESEAGKEEQVKSENVEESAKEDAKKEGEDGQDKKEEEEEKDKEEDQDKEKDKEKEKDKPKLIGNGGATDKYVWTQTLKEVEVRFELPQNLRSKHLDIKFGAKQLLVGVKGQKPIVQGELDSEIDPLESTWTLDQQYGKDTKTLVLQLSKKRSMNWWKCVIVGDAEIDTQAIEPESSQLSDLDPETRQVVEKMMFDQRQKAAGLPTSQELEHRKIMEKFKHAHPEMDFSNVKFA